MGELLRVRLASNYACEAIVFVPLDCPWDRLKGVISLRLGSGGTNVNVNHLVLVDKNNEELSGNIRDTATLCSFFEIYHADDDMAFLVYESDSEEDESNTATNSKISDDNNSFSKSLLDLMTQIDVQSQSWVNDGISNEDIDKPQSNDIKPNSENIKSTDEDFEELVFCMESNIRNKITCRIPRDTSWTACLDILSSKLNVPKNLNSNVSHLTLHGADGDELSSNISSMSSLWKVWIQGKKEKGSYLVVYSQSFVEEDSSETDVSEALEILEEMRKSREEQQQQQQYHKTDKVVNVINVQEAEKTHVVKDTPAPSVMRATSPARVQKSKVPAIPQPQVSNIDVTTSQISPLITQPVPEPVQSTLSVPSPVQIEQPIPTPPQITAPVLPPVQISPPIPQTLTTNTVDVKHHRVLATLSSDPKRSTSFEVPFGCAWDILIGNISKGLVLNAQQTVTHIILVDEDGDDLSPPINSEQKFRKFDAIYGDDEDLICTVYVEKTATGTTTITSTTTAAESQGQAKAKPVAVAPVSAVKPDVPLSEVPPQTPSQVPPQTPSQVSAQTPQVPPQTPEAVLPSAPTPQVSTPAPTVVAATPSITTPKPAPVPPATPSAASLTVPPTAPPPPSAAVLKSTPLSTNTNASTSTKVNTKSLNTFLFALSSTTNAKVTLTIPLECNWTVLTSVLGTGLGLDFSVSTERISNLVLFDNEVHDVISPAIDTDTKFWKYAQRYRDRKEAAFIVYCGKSNVVEGDGDNVKTTLAVSVCLGMDVHNQFSSEISSDSGWNALITKLSSSFKGLKVYSIDHIIAMNADGSDPSSPIIDTAALWKTASERKKSNLLLSLRQVQNDMSEPVPVPVQVLVKEPSPITPAEPVVMKPTLKTVTLAVKLSTSTQPPVEVVIPDNGTWNDVMEALSETFILGKEAGIEHLILMDTDGDELSPPLNTSQKFWKFGADYNISDGSFFVLTVSNNGPQVVAINMFLAVNNTVAGRMSCEVVNLIPNSSWDIIVAEVRKTFVLTEMETILQFVLVDNNGDETSPKLENAMSFWKFGSEPNGKKFAVVTSVPVQDSAYVPSPVEGKGPDDDDDEEDEIAIIQISLAGNSNRKAVAKLPSDLCELELMTLIAEALGTSQTKWIISLSLEDKQGAELTGPLMSSTGFYKLYSKGHLKGKENEVIVYGEYPSVTSNGIEHFLNACAKGDRTAVKRLLALSDPSLLKGQDNDGMRPLHHAAKGGHMDVIRLLINVDKEVDAADNKGMTALHHACANMFPEIALFLGKHGANVTMKNKIGLTPLHYVCLRGMVEVAAQFLTPGTVNLATTSGLSLLHCACDRGHADIAEYLMTHGARVQCFDNEGLSPLQYTCLRGHLKVAQCLVSHGALINTRDQDGMSAFLYACSDGHIEVAKWLVATGASINARSNAGNNALHLAADIGDKELLRWLVECGMDVNARSYDGLTPLHLALKMGRMEAALWLESAGAKNRHETDEELSIRVQRDKTDEETLRQNESCLEEKEGSDDYDFNAIDEESHNDSPDVSVSNENVVMQKSDPVLDQQLREACSAGDVATVKRILAGVANVHSRNENGSRPLHFACVSGNLQIAQMLFDAGADISAANNRGSTALHFACDRKHVELALWLFEHGASVMVRTVEGYTPLHYVSVRGLDGLLQVFAEKSKFLDVNVTDNKKFTLLHCASEEGHANVVKLLVRLNGNINARDNEDRLPLHLACLRGHLAVARVLIEHNADVNIVDSDGNTALFYACLGGSLELSRWLVTSGASLGRGNKRGNTCLHAACQIGHKEMAMWLLQAGVRLDIRNVNGHTPVDFAYEANHIALAKLLEKKLDELSAANKNRIEQLTSFHDACMGTDVKLVEEFLEKGADPNALNENDSNSLHFSCASGQEDTTKLLIAAGANVNMANNTGLTPFHCACLGGHLSLAKYLVHHVGVDFQKKTNNGANALHHAAHNGHLKVVKWLVSLGVSIDSLKNDGYKVIHEACRGGHSAVVKYLMKQGVSLTSLTSDNTSNLQIACGLGYTELAQWVYSEGVPLDAADSVGMTPFLAACAGGQVRTVKWLVSMGVDTRRKGGATDVLDTGLHHACRNGHLDTVKFLIEVGQDAYALNEKQQTAIEVASNEDNLDVAYWLLVRGPHFLTENMAKGSMYPALDTAISARRFDEANTMLLDILSDTNINIASGTTPLHFAAVAGHLELTQFILNSKAEVDAETVVGMTPLHYAAYTGKFDVMQLLVGHGAKVDKLSITADTPEVIAVKSGHGYVARWLQDRARSGKNISPFFACVSASDATASKPTAAIGSSVSPPPPAHLSILKKNTRSLLFACISSDPTPTKSESTDSVHNNTLSDTKKEELFSPLESKTFNPELHDAVTSGRIDTVRSVIDKGADVNANNPNGGASPLHTAALSGNCSIAEMLVDKGAKVDAQNVNGMTPLHIACEYRHTAFALFLIRRGADLTIRNKAGDSSLHRMSSKGMLELILKIIELPRSVLRVLDLDIKSDKGVSLLHCAVENGHIEVVRLLISQTVNVNPRDEENRTPLHYACIKGNYEISDILIRSGAFVKARDNQGCSPLLCACIARNCPLAKLLHANGANVFADDAQGNNPLHIACKAGEAEMAKWLVSLNVNPSQVNNEGITATQFANEGGFSDLFEWLLAWTLASSVGGTVEDVLAETRPNSQNEMDDAEEGFYDEV